jgi:tRNA A-37 threonylcarbamoyl transferase component Bud32
MPPPLDTHLPPRYRHARLLAHGGMADVYAATDEELGREVAVKVLAARYAEDESFRRRFRREALAAARLSSHPHIVTIFDVGEHEGRPLIVMELLPGGSLAERAAGAPRPPREVLDWLDDAAAALDAAHAAGVVHRDVKPANLLVDERGGVKVADFGIASAAGLDSFTHTGTVLGTAGYLSPEQARGERAGPASDLYGLAVVAWELLTGRRPFESGTPTEEAAAHVRSPVPPITAANPTLPHAYDAIFARALAKDPAGRPATAAELVGDLRRALADDAGDTWVVPGSPAGPAAPVRRRRWWPVPLVVALLAAGALAAFLTTRGSDAPTVVRTVTRPGTTVERTVTTAPPTTAATTTAATTAAGTTTTAPPGTGASGAALNDAGFARMQAGDYRGALPLLEQAVAQLDGTGSLTEAYAEYNLAYTRFALGDCTDVLALLDDSERIQGRRHEIDRLRHDARKAC